MADIFTELQLMAQRAQRGELKVKTGSSFLQPFTSLARSGSRSVLASTAARKASKLATAVTQEFGRQQLNGGSMGRAAPLTPGTFPAPTNTYGSDVYGDLTNAGCNFITDARLRAACIALGSVISRGGGGGGGSTLAATCPEGYKPDGNGGCQVAGLGPYLPGDIGPQDFGWRAINGRFGAGYTPIMVERNYRACPPGSKLGKDGVCYDRIARTNRAHNPGRKPLFTGGDMATLARARSIQKRGRRALAKVMPAAKKCGPTKRRKR